jgi:transcriptional regulator with XRE-family HTH domain
VATDIGRLLRDRRTQLGLTQHEAAAMIAGDSKIPDSSTLCRWELGQVHPNIEQASGIAEFLDVPLSDVLRLIHLARTRRSKKAA